MNNLAAGKLDMALSLRCQIRPEHLDTRHSERNTFFFLDVAQPKMNMGKLNEAKPLLGEVLNRLADRPADDAIRVFTVGLWPRA